MNTACHHRLIVAAIFVGFVILTAPATAALSGSFVFTSAPFPQCHASTVVQTARGTVLAAWFGGTREKHPDVGIWISRLTPEGWSMPQEVADGREPQTASRYPTWNPVLFQPRDGPLMLFYKVGPDPEQWWGMLMVSHDDGLTWEAPQRLPDHMLGPIKNKPLQLADGRILCPSSEESPENGWTVHIETTDAMGRNWRRTVPLSAKSRFDAIQPSILVHRDNRLQLLCRSKQGVVITAWSSDGGRTWSELQSSGLPNPNSGTDAVSLVDGRHLLVYNPTVPEPDRWGGPRTPLVLAVSDDGINWRQAAVLEQEPGEYSYPAVIQASDGRIHITYTWQRTRIKHVTLWPQDLPDTDIME